MTDPSHLLRVEGVNMGAFLYDTEDLSTIRGGGLLLLGAPDDIQAVLKQSPHVADANSVRVVTKGASQAIFSFDVKDPGHDPEKVRKEIDLWLRRDPRLGQATFVVDVLPAGERFSDDKERLLALSRFRQLGQARVVVPAPNPRPPAERERPYCGIDFVRPAAHHNPTPNDDKRRVSESVHVRVEYGKEQKQLFYERLLVGRWSLDALRHRLRADKVLFARHFHEIGARGRHRVGDDKAELTNLNDKIAVIYIDGNHFGKTQSRLLRAQAGRAGAEKLQGDWDRHVQDELRKPALEAILKAADANDGWLCQSDPRNKPGEYVIRFETPLWGGDDLCWVVPAWKGWETVRLFFDAVARAYGEGAKGAAPVLAAPAGRVRNLDQPRRPARGAAHGPWGRLTHAAGVVFCHADSPIHRITKLAVALSDAAKDAVAHKEDALAYVVLESFDQLGPDLGRARAAHLPAGCDPAALVIRGPELPGLTKDLRTMIDHFPRGSVYRLLAALRGPAAGPRQPDEEGFRFWLERALREFPDVPGVPSRFCTRKTEKGRPVVAVPPPDGRAAWLHLAELWDYLPPDTPSGGPRP